MSSAAHTEAPITIPAISGNLMGAGLLAGIIIATVNFFTQPIRERNQEEQREEARREALPAAVNFEKLPGFQEGSEWYRGKNAAGQLVGYVMPVTTRGYDGKIEMVLGVDADLAITDFRILKHSETPGLGAKAVDEAFRSRFRGRKLGQLEVTKSPDPKKVLAITGATITSRAVASALDKRLARVAELAKNGFNDIPADLAGEGGHHE